MSEFAGMKVALLVGGDSPEREVSMMSGEMVARALRNLDAEVVVFDSGRRSIFELPPLEVDRAFIILHGGDGENGAVQGALRMMKIPFTGSGVAASALAMDKYRAKLVWRAAGICTPPFCVIGGGGDNELRIIHAEFSSGGGRAPFTLVADANYNWREAAERIGFPLFVKPSGGGSSIGARRADNLNELEKAASEARAYDSEILAEKLIDGEEYTAAILGYDALPLIKVETPHEFYDYRAKYFEDSTRYFCPCGLDEKAEMRLRAESKRAFDLLGCSGWGRADFILDGDGVAHFLEVNAVPGMTSHSLVPMAARAAGIEFDELIARILREAKC